MSSKTVVNNKASEKSWIDSIRRFDSVLIFLIYTRSLSIAHYAYSTFE